MQGCCGRPVQSSHMVSQLRVTWSSLQACSHNTTHGPMAPWASVRVMHEGTLVCSLISELAVLPTREYSLTALTNRAWNGDDEVHYFDFVGVGCECHRLASTSQQHNSISGSDATTGHRLDLQSRHATLARASKTEACPTSMAKLERHLDIL